MIIAFYVIHLRKRCKTFQLTMIIDFYTTYLRKKMQKFSIHNNN